jgi:hypothetical protein
MMLVGQLVKDTFNKPVWTILVGEVKDHGVRSVDLQYVISSNRLYRLEG